MKHFGILFSSAGEVSTILFVLSLLCLLFACFLIVKRWRYSLFALFITSLLLGFAFATLDPFFHVWDEQYHALVAKNLIQSPLHPRLYVDSPLNLEYIDWTRNSTWLHKQPLSLWQMALSISLFGNTVVAARIPSIIMHALLVFPIFSMGKIIWNKRIGLYSALVFSVLLYPLELVSGVFTADHIDVAFMFYITLSVWAWLKYEQTKQFKWLFFIGLFSGFAVLTKWLVGLLVYAGFGLTVVFFSRVIRDWLKLGLAIVVTMLIAIPWQIYAWQNFPIEFQHEMGYNAKHFSEVIEDHGGDWTFYWDNIALLYKNGFIIQLLIVLSLIGFAFGNAAKKHKVFLLTAVLFPYLFFSLAATKMNSFLVIVSPLVVLIVVSQLYPILNKVVQCSNHRSANTLVKTTFIVIVALTILRPKEITNNHHLSSYFDPQVRKDRIAYYDFVANYNFPEDEKIVIFDANIIGRDNIVWMYFHDVKAYDHHLWSNDRYPLLKQGYSIYSVKTDLSAESVSFRLEKLDGPEAIANTSYSPVR